MIKEPYDAMRILKCECLRHSNCDECVFFDCVAEECGLTTETPDEWAVPASDNVNRPSHYCKGGLECIDIIKAQLGQRQYIGYLYGNVLKYMWRWQDKNGVEDLRKAAHYLEWLIKEEQEHEEL